MENHRLLLYISLFFIMYLLWAEWEADYGPKPVVTQQTQQQTSEQTLTGNAIETAIPEASTTSVAPPPGVITTTNAKTVDVITDVLKLKIDTRGGDIVEAQLRNYAVEADEPEVKVSLLTNKEVNFHIAQSGIVSADSTSAPTHSAMYQAEQDYYELAEGEDSVKVVLHWRNEQGVQVSKTYTFARNSYVIDVEHNITAGPQNWSGSQYMQLVRNTPDKSNESAFIYTYTGGVIYNDEIKYEKIDFGDMAEANLKRQLDDGWLAMIQHYFLAAWIPETGNNNLYYTRYNSNNDRYVLGARSPALKLAANESGQFKSRLVVGPKLQYQLETVAPGLELTVDYGVLTILAKPLFWLLDVFHGWFGNWGWAIIFLTITVKAIFYKLSEMSYKSMAKMRKVAPRMQQMKERFGDDRQAMSKAMMDMYKREKINPLGGCFPILVQIPVFIALYWVLLESVEMRHAPFMLWITNLSAKDPYFILPVIMGISMYIQQKLNPAPIDPMQQKIFQIMPFAFTIMFAFFPSGLVLYWVVNNILSIAQQWVITRNIEKAS